MTAMPRLAHLRRSALALSRDHACHAQAISEVGATDSSSSSGDATGDATAGSAGTAGSTMTTTTSAGTSATSMGSGDPTTDPTDPDGTGSADTGMPGDAIYAEDFSGSDGDPWPTPWAIAGNGILAQEIDGGRGCDLRRHDAHLADGVARLRPGRRRHPRSP